ncbi:MAG TPA: helix-turn-helix domain-containing protein [Pedobacter sp.]
MSFTENIEQYYRSRPQGAPNGLSTDNTTKGHINVYYRNEFFPGSSYKRHGFYKLVLILSTGRFCMADREINIDRPALVFFNPTLPYTWEPYLDHEEGWFCVFNDDFIQSRDGKETLLNSPLFRSDGNHLFFLHKNQQRSLISIFKKMKNELNSGYIYKYDLLKDYMKLIIHQGIKMQSADFIHGPANSAAKTTGLFLKLLEEQFLTEDGLLLKTAADYAHSLYIHTNHLNKSVKQITGKTTTSHIAEKIIREAHSLLLQSKLSIAEIAYKLGFDDPAYFTRFFKKNTGTLPSGFRP